MSIQDVIRAWRDSSYRATLSEEQLASLPPNPAGDALSDEELQEITGGNVHMTPTAHPHTGPIMHPTETAHPQTPTVDTNHHHHHHHPKTVPTVDVNHQHQHIVPPTI